MSENEKLRALLAEARERLFNLGVAKANAYDDGDWPTEKAAKEEVAEIHASIDAALAEPVENWKQAAEIQEQFKLAAMKERDEARAEVKALCEAAEDLMSSMGCGCCGSASFHDDAATLRDAIEKAEKAMKVKP
jgi:hypothetical protein